MNCLTMLQPKDLAEGAYSMSIRLGDSDGFCYSEKDMMILVVVMAVVQKIKL